MCWQFRAAFGPTHARKQNSVSEMKLVHSWYCSALPKVFPKTRPPTVSSDSDVSIKDERSTTGREHTRVTVPIGAMGV